MERTFGKFGDLEEHLAGCSSNNVRKMLTMWSRSCKMFVDNTSERNGYHGFSISLHVFQEQYHET